MSAVIHRTPGLIPIEAFTVAGLSAKPNSNSPIGKFGTGLKYAIAVLVRMDISVTVFIGQTEYVFYKTKKQFRGKDYEAIRMKKRSGLMAKWSYHDMPFTTEYGKYWELWQVFRELHANTLDEDGMTFAGERNHQVMPPNETWFVIEDSRYVDVYHERDRIFLPEGKVVREDEAIQVIDKPSNYIYFRGMRVMDLKKPAQYTYNFLEDVSLTEDRTVKWPHMVEARIVGFMQECEDKAFIRKTVATPPKDSYEGSLHHGTGYASGWSPARLGTVYLEAAKNSTNITAKEVWDGAQPTVPSAVLMEVKIPKPGISETERQTLYDIITSCYGDATVSFNGITYSPAPATRNEEMIF